MARITELWTDMRPASLRNSAQVGGGSDDDPYTERSGMRTQLLGKLDFDQERLLTDLDRCAEFHYAETYGEFGCGRPWKSAMLWSVDGEVGDGVITHYDTKQNAGATAMGKG